MLRKKPSVQIHVDGDDHYETTDKGQLPIHQDLTNSYWLCRICLIRFLAFLYLVAFSVAFDQNEGLVGEKGLIPATIYLERLSSHYGSSPGERFWRLPTLFWFVAPTAYNLNIVALVGLCLSAGVFIKGTSNAFLFATLWILYMSVVNVGQTWYGFGWESQILECGFLTIFAVPIVSLARFPKRQPMPLLVIWGHRWLIFRIMIGAGMIKIRGDECWRDLTCMNYHYLTQPIPNPLSPHLHSLPEAIHVLETLANHVVELLLPWLILVPYYRYPRLVGGVAQIIFQCVLISSGNLSFLNWLTMLPSICCFDDRFLSVFFTGDAVKQAQTAQYEWIRYRKTVFGKKSENPSDNSDHSTLQDTSNDVLERKHSSIGIKGWTMFRWGLHVAVAALLISRSVPVVVNLVSSGQVMNTSFDPFRLVNTYGAFGSVTKIRKEVVLQGTRLEKDTNLKDIVWRDYEFKCKPGNLNRAPCLISPFHYRLDWLMWFAAFQNYQRCPWLVHLSVKLLKGDALARSLLSKDGDPFVGQSGGTVPSHIRAILVEYEYVHVDSKTHASTEEWEQGRWWRRRIDAAELYMPILSLQDESVLAFLRHHALVGADEPLT